MTQSMHGKEGFIAADWGTTNRRAYLIGSDGSHSAEFEDDRGVLSVGRGAFRQAVAEIRERLGDLPLVLAGMVGSNRGWVEVPYVPCPAGIEDVAKRVVWAEEGRTAIVPGVSFVDGDRADVMRGEEVQILGAVASGTVPSDCLVCHPGTHNKWIVVEGGRIACFRTVMTGELFNLLREHSILSELLSQPAEVNSAYRSGVRHSIDNDDLTAELFTVRARVLLGKAEPNDAASYVSGLMIGADVRTGCKDRSGEVVVMGRPELTRLYAAALEEMDRSSVEIDGEKAFIQGIGRLAELIK